MLSFMSCLLALVISLFLCFFFPQFELPLLSSPVSRFPLSPAVVVFRLWVFSPSSSFNPVQTYNCFSFCAVLFLCHLQPLFPSVLCHHCPSIFLVSHLSSKMAFTYSKLSNALAQHGLGSCKRPLADLGGGLSNMAATSKLTRSSSSLVRSPSIKISIDSLSCLDEALTHKNAGRVGHSQRQDVTKKKQKKLRVCVFLPPLVVVVFPCVYLYARSSNNVNVHFLRDNGQAVAGFWLDYVFLVFFFSAVLVAVRLAYPQLNLVYRLRCSLSNNWGCLILTCLKPLGGLLTDERDKSRASGTSCVTWTIGSKPKLERLKSVKEGVQTYSNGDVYEGEFHQGRFSGSGVYHFYLSGRYMGDWVDGKFDGHGVETWARGSRYRGHYRCGLREGYGVYRFFTGDVYSGEWTKGQSHGRGIQTCVDGSRYVGEFKWGVKHGFGYYHFRNGDTYSGEYFADKMHGYGVYQFANGHRYEGAWHEGKRQGLGMYEFRNGERQGGHWQAGSLQTHSSHIALPGAPVAVSHSKVLHAVQESRRASAKALQVPHVDDRVNKAVAAANRAASAARVVAMRAVQTSRSNGTARSGNP